MLAIEERSIVLVLSGVSLTRVLLGLFLGFRVSRPPPPPSHSGVMAKPSAPSELVREGVVTDGGEMCDDRMLYEFILLLSRCRESVL